MSDIMTKWVVAQQHDVDGARTNGGHGVVKPHEQCTSGERCRVVLQTSDGRLTDAAVARHRDDDERRERCAPDVRERGHTHRVFGQDSRVARGAVERHERGAGRPVEDGQEARRGRGVVEGRGPGGQGLVEQRHARRMFVRLTA